MSLNHLSRLACAILSTLFIKSSLAIRLEPIDLLDHEEKHIVARDNDYSKLDLLSTETFLWGGMCHVSTI
jgi:hypothetical protein